MVRAILDPETQAVKGVILIDLKLRVIAETVQDVSLGKSGYLMVIDNKGESIYTPEHPLVSKFQRSWIDEIPRVFFKNDRWYLHAVHLSEISLYELDDSRSIFNPRDESRSEKSAFI